MKRACTPNTYQAGQFWPASTRVLVVLRIEGAEEEVIGSAATDAIGQFSLQVPLPSVIENSKNEVEIRAADQPYSAWFDF